MVRFHSRHRVAPNHVRQFTPSGQCAANAARALGARSCAGIWRRRTDDRPAKRDARRSPTSRNGSDRTAGCSTPAAERAPAPASWRGDFRITSSSASTNRRRVWQRTPDSAIPVNAILARCDCIDFWQLAAAENLRCERQFLLYPNPWPKPDQLQRRWHAHPVFPALLALEPRYIELRTNWRVYADEFCDALTIAGIDASVSELRSGYSAHAVRKKICRVESHSLAMRDSGYDLIDRQLDRHSSWCTCHRLRHDLQIAALRDRIAGFRNARTDDHLWKLRQFQRRHHAHAVGERDGRRAACPACRRWIASGIGGPLAAFA